MRYVKFQIKKFLHTVFYKVFVFVAVFLITLEISLNILSFFHDTKINSNNPATEYGATKIILCLGCSHTQGIGAKAGHSYPDYLQKILNTQYPEQYTVVNLGHGGNNTSQIFNAFKTWTQTNSKKADIVVMQGGINNQWNSLLFSEYKNTGKLNHLLFWGEKLKMVKLFKIMMLHVKSRNKPHMPPEKNHEKFNEAIQQQNPIAALKAMLAEIEIVSKQEPTSLQPLLLELRDLVINNPQVNPETSQKILAILQTHAKKSKIIKELYLHVINTEKLNDWIEFDYQRVLDLCSKEGSYMLVVNDPNPTQQDSLRQRFALKNKLALCPLKQLHTARDENPEKYISTLDNYHNNAAGYMLMANLVFETLKTSGKLDIPASKGLKK